MSTLHLPMRGDNVPLSIISVFSAFWHMPIFSHCLLVQEKEQRTQAYLRNHSHIPLLELKKSLTNQVGMATEFDPKTFQLRHQHHHDSTPFIIICFASQRTERHRQIQSRTKPKSLLSTWQGSKTTYFCMITCFTSVPSGVLRSLWYYFRGRH